MYKRYQYLLYAEQVIPIILYMWITIGKNKKNLSVFMQKTRHVFVTHGCPQRQQSQNMAKSLSPKFDPAPPQSMSITSVRRS